MRLMAVSTTLAGGGGRAAAAGRRRRRRRVARVHAVRRRWRRPRLRRRRGGRGLLHVGCRRPRARHLRQPALGQQRVRVSCLPAFHTPHCNCTACHVQPCAAGRAISRVCACNGDGQCAGVDSLTCSSHSGGDDQGASRADTSPPGGRSLAPRHSRGGRRVSATAPPCRIFSMPTPVDDFLKQPSFHLIHRCSQLLHLCTAGMPLVTVWQFMWRCQASAL